MNYLVQLHRNHELKDFPESLSAIKGRVQSYVDDCHFAGGQSYAVRITGLGGCIRVEVMLLQEIGLMDIELEQSS